MIVEAVVQVLKFVMMVGEWGTAYVAANSKGEKDFSFLHRRLGSISTHAAKLHKTYQDASAELDREAIERAKEKEKPVKG